jgi:glycosyltransferase involved in cell wall biosynthesis
MRLAVDGSGLGRPAAGIATYTREVLTAMRELRPDVEVDLYLPRGAPHLPGPLNLGMPPARLVGRHLQWPRAIRRSRATAYFGPVGLLPIVSVGVPTVITIHDVAIYRNPAWFPSQPLSTRVVVPRSIRAATRLLAVSECTRRDLAELFGVVPERVTVTPLAAGLEFRPLDPDTLAGVARKLDLPERFLLFVGTIEPRKNVETLLDAWQAMDDRPHLVLAGSWGWRVERLRRRIENTPGVKVIGALPAHELACVYNLAACLVHPAWYEGFGLTPLEAMACGTPVICSDRASLPEVVGDVALTVPPDDVRALSAAMRRVLDEPAAAAGLRERGLGRAREFSWQRTAAATWASIDSALEAATR